MEQLGPQLQSLQHGEHSIWPPINLLPTQTKLKNCYEAKGGAGAKLASTRRSR